MSEGLRFEGVAPTEGVVIDAARFDRLELLEYELGLSAEGELIEPRRQYATTPWELERVAEAQEAVGAAIQRHNVFSWAGFGQHGVGLGPLRFSAGEALSVAREFLEAAEMAASYRMVEVGPGHWKSEPVEPE